MNSQAINRKFFLDTLLKWSDFLKWKVIGMRHVNRAELNLVDHSLGSSSPQTLEEGFFHLKGQSSRKLDIFADQFSAICTILTLEV